MKRYEKQEKKRIEAEARKGEWEALNPLEQLKCLQNRGHGHCKQAKNLEKILTRKSNG